MSAPDSIRRTIGTSCTDPHLVRSAELEELADFTAAGRVGACGTFEAGPRTRHCWRRDCPTCAERLAARYGSRMLAGSRSFQGSVVLVGLLALTADLFLLRDGFSTFRRALTLLRRRQPMRSVVLGGSGALEPKLVRNQTRWNLHAHVLLDATTVDFPEQEIRAQWRALTGGVFSLNAPDAKLRSAEAFTKYATKTAAWAPPPGMLQLWRYDLLRKGVHGRQLVVRWGTGFPRRTP